MDLNKSWHSIRMEDVFKALQSNPEGLEENEAAQRLEELGRNEISQEKASSWVDILKHQLVNPLVAVLMIAGVIAVLAGEMKDAIVIAVVIVVNTAIGTYQEYRAEAAIEALRSRAAPQADVVRCKQDGSCEDTQINTTEIVPGDVILVAEGDKVPADGRVIEAFNLEVDESMLTGESLPVSKQVDPLDEDIQVADRTNLIYGGSIVTGGRGRAVVFATGDHTQMGQIAALIQETEKAASPLQLQTIDLGKKLGGLAFLAGLIIFIMGFLRGLPIHELLMFSIAAIVSAIPEGLPAVMTITLAVGVNRMAKRNAIIRRLQAVDTLGAATVICSDKTGTLTTNQMTVQQIYIPERIYEVTGGGYQPEGEFKLDGQIVDPQEDRPLTAALKIAALCNDARLQAEGQNGSAAWTVRGDPTEGALVVVAQKANLDKGELEEEFRRVEEIPFSSQNKFMATFHETGERGAVVYLKGAPEVVLKYCNQITAGGEVVNLDDKYREKVQENNQAMANAALRVLAVARRDIKAEEIPQFTERLDRGESILVFSGLIGMMDPPRPEAVEAVERCKRAGIRVIMITGDHQTTGEAIARQVGILGQDGQAITGRQLDQMSETDLDQSIVDTAVFARVSPAHKQQIVAALQRQGQVVSMTGDGVNDAPALKAAEIGVAMGITGTDVTKETAEMVLVDDNFASIVNAVEEGRVVFQNIRKVVKFLISTNAGEILTILAALWLLPIGQLIFTPIQILWVNLVTDGLLDIAIALEPKEGDVMAEAPRKPGTRIINREMVFVVIFVALIMAVGTLWIYMREQALTGSARAQTMAFITIAMFQVFNALNVRSERRSLFQIGVFTNKYLIGAMIISVSLLVLSTFVPFLQVALSTIPLNLEDWALIVLVTSSIFFLEEIRKLIQRRIMS